MAINANREIKKFKTAEDKAADKITSFAGTMSFVYIHSVWFGVWVLINLGLLGAGLKFDAFPFGLLTLIVSLEAIFLSTFVMISQNRQANAAEIRSELDYQTDVKAEREIDIIMKTMQRIAEKQGVEIDDLLTELETARKLPGVSR
ncbi:MAG TPA: DUF1003 domain-containing protein [Candidatus Saccharimonadales bacterium]|nr:DUF1003 domain-containing protein [Candidatus Saccharimonadales bacterium]